MARRDDDDLEDSDDDAPVPEPSKSRGQTNKPKLAVPRWTGLYLGIAIFGALAFACSIAIPPLIYVALNSRRDITTDRVDTAGNVVGNYTDRLKGPFKDQAALIAGVSVMGALSLSLAWVLINVWLYRAWSIVPPKYGGVGPLKAVLFLFIPLFNIYWMFRVIPGLSKAYGRILEDLEPDRTPKTGFGAGAASCILPFIPGFSVFAPIAFLSWLDSANFAKNRIELLEAQA